MKILFDNGAPNPVARSLVGHEVTFARKIGWHELENGELIERAELAQHKIGKRGTRRISRECE